MADFLKNLDKSLSNIPIVNTIGNDVQGLFNLGLKVGDNLASNLNLSNLFQSATMPLMIIGVIVLITTFKK